MTPPTAALPIARFLALVKEAHGQLDPMTMTQAVEIADAAIEAKCELFAACAPAVQATADADGAIKAAAEEVIREMYSADGVGFERGYKDQEFDVEADIAACEAIINKHLRKAVSPKAGATINRGWDIFTLAELSARDCGCSLSLAGRIGEAAKKMADAAGVICGEASLPAVSVGEQEK